MSLFRTQNPLRITNKSFSYLSLFARTLKSFSSSQTAQTKNKKPLSVIFDEVIGLREKAECESESDSNDELKIGLKELEKEVRHLKAESKNREKLNVNEKKKKTESVKAEERKDVKNLGLYTLFVDKYRAKEEKKAMLKEGEEPSVLKELLPDMEMFVRHLHKEGYFDKANFLPGDRKRLDLSCFNDSFSRNFTKFAAYQYGKDHQELAK